MSSLNKQVGNVVSKLEDIEKKISALMDDFGVDEVRKAFREIEAERFAKDALQKLLDGLWSTKK